MQKPNGARQPLDLHRAIAVLLAVAVILLIAITIQLHSHHSHDDMHIEVHHQISADLQLHGRLLLMTEDERLHG